MDCGFYIFVLGSGLFDFPVTFEGGSCVWCGSVVGGRGCGCGVGGFWCCAGGGGWGCGGCGWWGPFFLFRLCRWVGLVMWRLRVVGRLWWVRMGRMSRWWCPVVWVMLCRRDWGSLGSRGWGRILWRAGRLGCPVVWWAVVLGTLIRGGRGGGVVRGVRGRGGGGCWGVWWGGGGGGGSLGGLGDVGGCWWNEVGGGVECSGECVVGW